MRSTTFRLWCHFQQCPWDLGSAPAERVGQEEMGRFQHWALVTWLLLSCRKPLVSTGWVIFLILCTNGLRKRSSGHVGPPFLAVRPIFLLCRGDHWPRGMTIASWLDSGCGLSHECAQDGCSGTCVKLEASKTHLKWKYGTFRGSIGLWLSQKRSQSLIS